MLPHEKNRLGFEFKGEIPGAGDVNWCFPRAVCGLRCGMAAFAQVTEDERENGCRATVIKKKIMTVVVGLL